MSVFAPRVLLLPGHPFLTEQFCKLAFKTSVLGSWESYGLGSAPAGLQSLIPTSLEAPARTPTSEELARYLDASAFGRFPGDFDFAWLMYAWQYQLMRDRKGVRKSLLVARKEELSWEQWSDVLGREDFTVVALRPSVVHWVRQNYGVELLYAPVGINPNDTPLSTRSRPTALSVIPRWKSRPFHSDAILPALRGVQHQWLDPVESVAAQGRDEAHAELLRAWSDSRVYVHDGDADYSVWLASALMRGLPVVAWRIPGIERFVVHADNGFVASSAAELREYVRMLLQDEDLAHSMGESSRRLAEREFSFVQWKSIWDEVLGLSLGQPRSTMPPRRTSIIP